MPKTLEYTETLVVKHCWCGIPHAVPWNLADKQQRDHDAGKTPKGIYCPLGHVWVPSGEPKTERLQRELDREKERRARAIADRDQALASERAQRGAATRARNERDRVRKRAKAGVCPCCKRTFKALAAHMKTKHPDYDPSTE